MKKRIISLFFLNFCLAFPMEKVLIARLDSAIELLFTYKDNDSYFCHDREVNEYNKQGFKGLVDLLKPEEEYALRAFYFYKCKSKEHKSIFSLFDISFEKICESIIRNNDEKHVKSFIVYSLIYLLIQDNQSTYFERFQEQKKYYIISIIFGILSIFFSKPRLTIKKIKGFREELHTISSDKKNELLKKALEKQSLIAVVFITNSFIPNNYLLNKDIFFLDKLLDFKENENRWNEFSGSDQKILKKSNWPSSITSKKIKKDFNGNGGNRLAWPVPIALKTTQERIEDALQFQTVMKQEIKNIFGGTDKRSVERKSPRKHRPSLKLIE